MNLSYNRWQKLFLFSLGLAAGAAFCMKWMESDFLVNDQKFSVLGLEIFYPKEKLSAIMVNLDGHVRNILRYHLNFDFAFMAGVYSGITALCMMAKKKTKVITLRKVLFLLAVLQLVAWGCDIAENTFLLTWIRNPAIGNGFLLYHLIVAAKWILALLGIFMAIPFAVRKSKLS